MEYIAIFSIICNLLLWQEWSSITGYCIWHIDLEGRPRKELVARCGVHVQWNGSIVVYKLCVLCCRSLKAGSFLIFVCLALRSLVNLHKSQKAFTELGWIEVAALVCFYIILTTWITQNRHPRKFIQGKETNQNILSCLSLLFMSCSSLFFPLFCLCRIFISLLLSSFASVSKEIDALYFLTHHLFLHHSMQLAYHFWCKWCCTIWNSWSPLTRGQAGH